MKNQFSPKVSIIIPSYNYEAFITDAINSVLAQTFQDFELIIVDDGSRDNSVSVVEGFAREYENIFLFTHEHNQNRGLSKTVQLGLEHVKGEYVAFLECDDIWEKDYLINKVEIFEKYLEVGIVFNDVETFGDENRINLLKDFFNDCRKRCAQKTYPASLLYETLMLETISNFSSAMMRKNVFKNLNFDSPIAPYLDWWLFSQITLLNSAYFVNKKLTRLRLHTQSYISNTKNEITIWDKKNMFKSLLELLKKLSSGDVYSDLTRKILLEKTKKAKSDRHFKEDFTQRFKDKKVFLYGAGGYLREVLKYYDFSPIKIQGVIDADKNKAGYKILDFPICYKGDIADFNPDVILISMQEPELVYADLKNFVESKGLDIPIITDFFNDVRYKGLSDKNLTSEEVLTELF